MLSTLPEPVDFGDFTEEQPLAQVKKQIADSFEHFNGGTVDCDLLSAILLELDPNLTLDEINRVMKASGVADGSVDLKTFIRWVFPE